MSKKKTISPYHTKTDEKTKKIINSIIKQLEQYGRATSTEGGAVRTFSRHLVEPIRKEYIYFDWNSMHKKSVITLPPSVKLIRTPRHKIKLVFEKDVGNY